MFHKSSIKLNQNTIIVFVIVIVLFAIIGFSASNILRAINTSREVDPDLLKSTDERINEANLKKALERVEKHEYIPLDLPE